MKMSRGTEKEIKLRKDYITSFVNLFPGYNKQKARERHAIRSLVHSMANR